MEQIIPVFDWNICLRIISAVLLGSAIGLEREMSNKYAGLRTNMLVCLGACVFTLISIYGFPMVAISGMEYGTRDTARVAAQVVTGIGFIGGGTVLRHGATVFGLTTAATLFAVASIGMACGAGMYGTAIVTTVIAIIVLAFIGFIERRILPAGTKNLNQLKIAITCLNEKSDEIYDFIIEKYPKLREISKKLSKEDGNITKIIAIIDINSNNPIKDTYKTFKNIDGIDAISIQELSEITLK